MTPTFNLIDESWIPVIDLEGHGTEVSMRHALAHAHEYQSVTATSGLATASILRLLLAVLHRTHDTSSRRAWGNLYQQGYFEEQALEAYWRTWSYRFDLFDPERPFYQQHAGRDDLNPKQIIEIYPGISTAAHYNHRVKNEEFFLTPGQSACGLLVSQTFGTGIGVIPSEKISIKASTWNSGLVFFIQGDSLFETLIYNLHRYDESNPSPELFQSDADRPNWEAANPYEPRDHPLGYLDYLTWPSRRVRLIPEIVDGVVVVRKFIDFVGLGPPKIRDPFKFYHRNMKAKPDEEPFYPAKLNIQRALWRNSGAVLRLHHDNAIAPTSLNWMADLKKVTSIRNPRTMLVAYGMVADKTKVDLVREERIPLPLPYLDQEADPELKDDLLSRLDALIKRAEQVGSALQASIFELAKEITPRVEKKQDPTADANKRLSSDEKTRIQHIANSLPSEMIYWASLERPFTQLVLDLVEADDPALIQDRWLAEILSAGRAALAEAEACAGQHPKALKAGVLARQRFEWKLREAGLTASQNSSQGE